MACFGVRSKGLGVHMQFTTKPTKLAKKDETPSCSSCPWWSNPKHLPPHHAEGGRY